VNSKHTSKFVGSDASQLRVQPTTGLKRLARALPKDFTAFSAVTLNGFLSDIRTKPARVWVADRPLQLACERHADKADVVADGRVRLELEEAGTPRPA
jgi:hypothetical protein